MIGKLKHEIGWEAVRVTPYRFTLTLIARGERNAFASIRQR